MGETGNVSLSGMLLLLPEKVEAGTLLRLQLQLADGPAPADGVVVWPGPQPTDKGYFHRGVRILRFPEEDGLVRYRRWLSLVSAADTA